MRAVLPSIATLAPAVLAGPALAHPGHLQVAGGHTHWLALAAFSSAAAIALFGVARAAASRRRRAETAGKRK